MKKQIDRTAYRFEKYCHRERWVSYHVQLQEIFRCAPTTLLEIGTGAGIVRTYIEQNSDISYTNVDIAEDLQPDVVGSVTELPFKSNSFDLVVAFQVLEHLPFEQFDVAL